MIEYNLQAWEVENWLVFIEILAKMKEKDSGCYKIYLRKDLNNHSIEFNLWCLDPSIAFQNIMLQKPYYIILTSGTLEPFDTW